MSFSMIRSDLFFTIMVQIALILISSQYQGTQLLCRSWLPGLLGEMSHSRTGSVYIQDELGESCSSRKYCHIHGMEKLSRSQVKELSIVRAGTT